MELGQQRLLRVVLREEEEDDRGAEQDRDDSGRVGPLIALEERRLRAGDDVVGVLRIPLRGIGRGGERLGQLVLHAVVDLVPVRRRGDRCARGRRVAGGEQRAEDRLHDRAAQIALEVGGPGRHPGAVDRHRAGERMRGRRPGKADADPDEAVAEGHLPVGDVLLPEQQHGQEAQQAEGVADQQGDAGATCLHELRRSRRDQDHERCRGQDREPGIERRVAEHVLQELLADEHRPHQRAEDDDPRHGRHPERPAPGDAAGHTAVPSLAAGESRRPPRSLSRSPPDRRRGLPGWAPARS